MAEELLDGTKIGAGVQKVGGEGMSDGMRGDLLMDRRLLDVLVEEFSNRFGG